MGFLSSDEEKLWTRPSAFGSHRIKYAVYVIVLIYLVWAFWDLRITPDRLQTGVVEVQGLLGDMFPPSTDRLGLIAEQTVISLQMSVISTIAGIIIAIPITFMASENLMPKPVYAIGRTILGITRAFHELVVAILFVALFGFGAFAGMLTLTFKSIGFIGKLLAEEIEDIDVGQVEAIKATGASSLQMWIYAIVPQVYPRFVGLSIYRWDINLRQSTIVGIVGAGGVGTTLIAAVEQFEYAVVATILLIIIALVMIGEVVSTVARKRMVEK